MSPHKSSFITHVSPTRREALYGLGAGIGSFAFAFASTLQAGGVSRTVHHPAKAKRCIFLMIEGGPSHIDTFDPKPELAKRHLQKFKRGGEKESATSSGERYFVKSPFDFIKAGKCGADFSVEWRHLKEMADDMCLFRGCQVESVNHPTACRPRCPVSSTSPTRKNRRSKATASAMARLMPLAANVCWRAASSRRESASSRPTPATGTATTTFKERMAR
jgi:hypothetical protein